MLKQKHTDSKLFRGFIKTVLPLILLLPYNFLKSSVSSFRSKDNPHSVVKTLKT